MGFDALSDRSKSAERARRRKSQGTEFSQEARMGSHSRNVCMPTIHIPTATKAAML